MPIARSIGIVVSEHYGRAGSVRLNVDALVDPHALQLCNEKGVAARDSVRVEAARLHK